MSDVTALSEELAEEYDVPEPEMWGSLAVLGVMGMSEGGARERIRELYNE